MKINALTPEEKLLEEMGARLARLRKHQGLTQQDLSEAAGLGIATLRRIEEGKDSQLSSWLKLLKALDRAFVIDQILPENIQSPMLEVLKRKRSKSATKFSPASFSWGDEEQ